MTDGERSILRQALRCGFLGHSQQRARKCPGGPLWEELPSQGFWEGKSHLAEYTGGYGSEGRDGSSGEPQGTGKQEEGAMASNTRNKECKAPRRPSTWAEDLVPGQHQLEQTGAGRLALLTWGATAPPRRLKVS